jgi:ABC-type thiamin/hydroxymethylpyrimidine transport system permease subunit
MDVLCYNYLSYMCVTNYTVTTVVTELLKVAFLRINFNDFINGAWVRMWEMAVVECCLGRLRQTTGTLSEVIR